MYDLVDTNVILRYLVGDNREQQERAAGWFAEGEHGKRRLVITALVVAESCFVLKSFYKKSRTDIAEAFEVLLSQRWLIVEDREVLLALWQWYRDGLHFVDSYLLAQAEKRGARVLSFDAQVKKRSRK
jgi:predicted nucleic-acid-binding protein